MVILYLECVDKSLFLSELSSLFFTTDVKFNNPPSNAQGFQFSHSLTNTYSQMFKKRVTPTIVGWRLPHMLGLLWAWLTGWCWGLAVSLRAHSAWRPLKGLHQQCSGAIWCWGNQIHNTLVPSFLHSLPSLPCFISFFLYIYILAPHSGCVLSKRKSPKVSCLFLLWLLVFSC